jgi:ParB family chromosome partitioning protein
MLLHVTQRLRDKRDIAAARAALVAELECQGKTIVEDAGYYADEEALYVSSANRADGEPATEEDANAYVIQRDWQGNHSAKPAITGWKELGFTPRHERYDGGRQAQSGPMTEEQKAERKTLITNNKAMESVLLTEL